MTPFSDAILKACATHPFHPAAAHEIVRRVERDLPLAGEELFLAIQHAAFTIYRGLLSAPTAHRKNQSKEREALWIAKQIVAATRDASAPSKPPKAPKPPTETIDKRVQRSRAPGDTFWSAVFRKPEVTICRIVGGDIVMEYHEGQECERRWGKAVRPHTGYKGAFACTRVEGAPKIGSRVETIDPPQLEGTLLGSVLDNDDGTLYFVEWDKYPAVAVLSAKVRPTIMEVIRGLTVEQRRLLDRLCKTTTKGLWLSSGVVEPLVNLGLAEIEAKRADNKVWTVSTSNGRTAWVRLQKFAPPMELDVLDSHGGFTEVRGNDTLWRPGSVAPKGTKGRLVLGSVKYNDKHRKIRSNAISALYELPGYEHRVKVAWYQTGERIIT
jgi:hypothetical protein